MKVIKPFLLILLLGLSACSDSDERHHSRGAVVHEYRQRTNDDGFIFWYILYSQMNNGDTQTYYYRSQTPVINFSSTPFTRSPTAALPKEVEQEIEKSEAVTEEQLTPDQEPAEAQNEVISEPTSSESSSTPESSSSDSSDSDYSFD